VRFHVDWARQERGRGVWEGRLGRASGKGVREGGDQGGSGTRAGQSAGEAGRGLAERFGAWRECSLKVSDRGAERVRARQERGRGV